MYIDSFNKFLKWVQWATEQLHLEDIGSSIEMLTGFAGHLLAGQASAFAEDLETFMKLMTSYYDTTNRESFYHGLVLGLLAILIPRYEVVS